MNTQELGRYLGLVPYFLNGRKRETNLAHNLQLIVRNHSRASLPYMCEVQRSGLSAISRVRELIPIQDCVICLTLLDQGVGKPDPSVNGSARTTTKDAVFITIGSSSPTFEEAHNTRTQGVVAHELHHIVRMRGTEITEILLQGLVSEGLAICFSEDYFGYNEFKLPFRGITQQDVESYWNKIKGRLFERIRPQDWFGLFVPGEGLPCNIGYLLGYYFIRNYLREHPNETPASLVQVPAEEFIK